MSLNDLDLILKKDPIISTWPAQSLVADPLRVETDYAVHAKTHLPLGETTRYVDNLFKWVSGANKGTFIGAVLGEYGEGKTSFLVHIWSESVARKVLAVPPFQWRTFEQIVDGIAGWLLYLLRDVRPDLALQVERLWAASREQTIELLARDAVQRDGGAYDTTVDTIRGLVESGAIHVAAMSASRLLDFCAKASEIVLDAGYQGLLVLLDEPEKAADSLGTQAVHLFLFDLADELLRRQGNYGFFVSLPRNFHALAVSRFPALTARLEGRGCFPSLSDLYGSDFARTLWQRYCQTFALGELAEQVVAPLTLEAIGQMGSSDRKDLSYGPRSVVSAFRRMVDVWRRTNEPYTPQQFVQDALDQEIMLPDAYRTKVQSVLRLPEVDQHNREAVMLLAAFPAGIRVDTLDELGLSEVLRPLSHSNGPVFRSSLKMGLRALALSGGTSVDQLQLAIEAINGEFAQDRHTFENALAAFCADLVPLVFRPREGHQLEGWQYLRPPAQERPLLYLAALTGAFPQTAGQYPLRAVVVMAGSSDASAKGIRCPKIAGESGALRYDLIFSFLLRWTKEQPELTRRAIITVLPDKRTQMLLSLDLTEGCLGQDKLAELVGPDRLSPLWVLNLLHCMKKEPLGREDDAVWQSLRAELLRKLLGAMLGLGLCSDLVDEAHTAFDVRPAGSGLELVGQVSSLALQQTYPDYDTLIRQPHWQARVDAYLSALRSADVPLAAKRGRDVWRPDDGVASRVLGATRMNLSGGAYAGYENLITIESKSRHAPLEIRFRAHPLEDELRTMICSQGVGPGRKVKHEGKECPSLALDELLPALLKRGYTVDELSKIIEIGKARGSYDEGRLGTERVLFCQPLDIPELQARLRAKLADLVAEIGQYKTLPEYASDLDDHRLSTEIDKVADDTDYERLLLRLNREFEANHQRLPGYFGRVQERLRNTRNITASLQGQLTGSRDVAQLSVPVARSPWRQALERYIVPNLQQEGDELREMTKSVLSQADMAIGKYVYAQGRSPSASLALLIEGLSVASAAEANRTTLADRTRQWLTHIMELNHWVRLLRADSDPLYERLLELKNDDAHRAKADELLAEFDVISQTTEDHIRLRNVTGLPSYEQFAQRYKELEEKKQDYLNTLKSSFEQRKNRVNALLEKAKLDGRSSVIFNPAAVSACYTQLYADGAQVIREVGCARILEELAEQQRDTQYARDVLRAISEADAAASLKALDDCRAKTDALNELATDVWLRRLAESWAEAEVDQVVASLDAAFGSIRAARQLVGEASRPSVPQDGRAAWLFTVLPIAGEADLKELILKMMSEVQDPSMALETSLEALAELFRRNCVQIHVGRRSR